MWGDRLQMYKGNVVLDFRIEKMKKLEKFTKKCIK